PELLESLSQTASRSSQDILRLNVGDTAHFITKYNDELMNQLIDAIRQGSLAPLDRLQLLHEQTLLARAGVINTASLIPLLQAYKNETEEAVWDIVSLAAGELRKFVETDPESEKRLKQFSISLAHQQYDRLGWEAKPGETEAEAKLRATIISMMIYGDDPQVVSEALERYRRNSVEAFDPELRPLIIGTAIRSSSDGSVLTTLIDTYRTTASAELREDIASGITMAKNTDDITRILEFFTDTTIIRPQDLVRWFAWTIRNRYGRPLAWQWLKNNWGWIKKKYDGDKSYDYFPRHSASALMTKTELEEYRDFFSPMLKEPALTRVITLGLSEIEGRVELLERDTKAVRDALAKL
ncbi:MAG TPA: ERAP1-like C-terminal domain-containing protein, partial [Candidatus Saccharimonadales bacterium]|nr:ERAP1-like C-terminal domain-containing protein [Candidatus Saccharimonadales bacterium]